MNTQRLSFAVDQFTGSCQAQLIALPITGLTPAQIKTARADTTALDGFFGTPGLYF